MTGLLELSARDLLARYASGDASPVDAVDEVAARSSAVDSRLGAFTTMSAAPSSGRFQSNPHCGQTVVVPVVVITASTSTSSTDDAHRTPAVEGDTST